MTDAVLVDGHVHLYPSFDVARFLRSAAENLAASARRVGVDPGRPSCLLLTETTADDAFGMLCNGSILPPAWRAERPEACALILKHHRASAPLVVIAGRQIRTREGIEVLAIGTEARPTDGDTLGKVLDRLAAENVPAILPWGVGKWTGRRGRIVADTLSARPVTEVFAGDNAGRPWGWPAPAAFKGRPVLAGTDPLPHPAAVDDVGRYGFLLDGTIELARPAGWICDRLRRIHAQPRCFGRRVGPPGFVIGQARMRFRR